MLPEVVVGVLDELNEGDEQSPRVGSVDYQPFQQHPTQGTRTCTCTSLNVIATQTSTTSILCF